jgi:hypothetical protein
VLFLDLAMKSIFSYASYRNAKGNRLVRFPITLSITVTNTSERIFKKNKLLWFIVSKVSLHGSLDPLVLCCGEKKNDLVTGAYVGGWIPPSYGQTEETQREKWRDRLLDTSQLWTN